MSTAPNLRRPKWDILVGDAISALQALPDASVHCVVTSPPYFAVRKYVGMGKTPLGFEDTPEEWAENVAKVFSEAWRVLRDDGTCWINIGDSFYGASNFSGSGDGTDGVFNRRHENLGKAASRKRKKHPWLKEGDLVDQASFLGEALAKAGWYRRHRIVWCLSGGTRVYARSEKVEGPRSLNELSKVPAESVELWTGSRWTKLVAMTRVIDRRPRSRFKVTLRSGERIGCTADHLWPTSRGLVRTADLRPGDVIRRCRTPEPNAPARPDRLDDESIGWLVGMFLSEGSLDSKNTIQISGHKNETKERMRRLAAICASYHATCRSHRATAGEGETICISSPIILAILKKYVTGRTAKDKGLTSACWERSNAFLSALLTGYLEGDGHRRKDTAGERWQIGFTRNYRLESDIRSICGRLGLDVRIKLSKSKKDGKEWLAFKGEILMAAKSGHWNEKDYGEVLSVTSTPATTFWNVEVADKTHLFSLASGVLTHNSKTNPVPDSAKNRPSTSHEYVLLMTKKKSGYFYDHTAVREEAVEPGKDRNRRSVWSIPSEPSPAIDGVKHTSTFARELARLCVAAGTSERGVCPDCGAPWIRRLSKAKGGSTGKSWHPHDDDAVNGNCKKTSSKDYVPPKTIGWKPSCKCPNRKSPVPAVVLDPFSGMATTGAVCLRWGRDYVGVELDKRMAEASKKRLRIVEQEESMPLFATQGSLFGDLEGE